MVDYQNTKKAYYRYLYKYSPDRLQNNNINIMNIFRYILEIYNKWKSNPNDPKLSPLNIDVKKLNQHLFDKNKTKKYYCINQQNKNMLIRDDDIETLLVKNLSKHFLEMFMDGKEVTPNFLDTIYKSVNGVSNVVDILMDDNTNTDLIKNIIMQLIQPSKNKISKIKYPKNNNSTINTILRDSDTYKIDENVLNNVRSEDIIYNVTVSINDIFNNVTKELIVNQKIICTKCNGRGVLDITTHQTRLCFRCNGNLTETKTNVYQLDIRKSKIIFPKEGHQGIDRNYGNLIIIVKPKDIGDYEIVDDYDLLTEVELSFIEVYTQFEFYLKYINGYYYHIKFSPENLSSKDNIKFRKKLQIRVRDKGLPIENTGRFGDLYIKFKVILPDINSEDIKKIKDISSFKSNRKSLVKMTQPTSKIDNSILAIEFI
jgi:DnaJ-class molecular chaperone